MIGISGNDRALQVRKILSTPYFMARDRVRREELDYCLRKNVENALIDRIVLFIDDGHLPPVESDKIEIRPIKERLTYADWLLFAKSIPAEHIAILANSDIFFDESLDDLDKILARKNCFVALSRFDKVGDRLEPHSKPQWSQDVWALNSTSQITPALIKAADFRLGVPRCDNKIVFEFAMHGWDIVNPFPKVRSIHVHESNIRGYDKEKNRELVGGMGFVRPQEDANLNSRVEITIWPIKSDAISHVRVVNALQEWNDKERKQTGESPILFHNKDWQYPAITEQWAFERMRRFKGLIPDGCAYLAYPWATLIDRVLNRPASAEPLFAALSGLGEAALKRERVVTVCQHIRLKQHQKIFADAGVTDIFWSHAVHGEDSLPDYPHIRLHPFPLYPVQITSEIEEKTERKHLFSFVGARSKDFYLTQSRNFIIDALGADKRGFVAGRDDWHYNKIVYDHQIKKASLNGEILVDQQASDEFKAILADSVFSLCPSGSGPNSIRLWESIGAGAVPVILADRYAPPGDAALWREAALFWPETLPAVKSLPDELEQLAADKDRLAAKRHALRQLWALYGPDWFVPDILHCFIEHASMKTLAAGAPFPIGESDLVGAAAIDDPDGIWGDGEFLLNAVTSRMLVNGPAFADVWARNPALREKCEAVAAREPSSPLSSSFEAGKNILERDAKRKSASGGRKPRIYLLGRNSTRTPLAYDGYRALFFDRLDFVSSAREADILLVGASPNLTEHSDEVVDAVSNNPSLKVASLSEEPLWDTTWTFDMFSKEKVVTLFDRKIPYAVLNHFTTSIFDFERLPYFVTTDDRFFVRYAHWFERNASLSARELLELWNAAKWRAAFFAEKRHGEIYDFRTPDRDLYGLCAYRSRVAEGMTGGDVLKIGKGWSTVARRQELADWHLDKFVTLDKRALIVSGLENTHFASYITEKLFDAYASLGAPVYYASPKHRIKEIVNDWSFINLFGKSDYEAIEAINAFQPDKAFAEAYIAAQKQLRGLFSDYKTLINERSRVVDEVVASLKGVLAGDKENE